MRHLDQEILAGIALGDAAPLKRSDRLHLRVCRQCAGELAELRGIVATGRIGRPDELRPPKPAVLAQIQAEIAGDAAPTGASTGPAPLVADGTTAVDLSSRRPASRPARRLATAAIAAAAVAAVSVGGVLWYRQANTDDVVVVARATLQPLPNKAGEGTAELVRKDGVDQLTVDVRAGSAGTGFEELWLINTDGRRMISLGVLPPDGRASYPVPVASGGGLNGYTIVDVSLEPYDGNVAHSKNSLLRGSLG